ncbi:ankyrin repeat domain-containing protein [Kordia sp.]|uniref:ankyrin repeat domain-containing protein n=1 Tax=Kordia sp. TaxID=1965332 RepID=UPI003B5B5D18
MVDKKQLKLSIITRSSSLIDVIDRLKEIDLDTNLDDGTALNYAVNYQKEDIVKYLLENGVNPNSAQKSGLTPLMSAIEAENMTLINLLLQYNADVTLRHKKGADALFKAIHQDNIEIIKLLLQHGANPYLEYKNYTNYQAVIDMNRDKNILTLFENYKN